MTVIVYKDGVMAADSAAWENDVKVTTTRTKIFRLGNGGLLGMSGEDRDNQAFRAWLETGGAKPKILGGRSHSAITVDPDGCVRVWDDHWQSFVETADWTIVGYHHEFVAGLLAAGLGAAAAVEVAITRCAYAGGTVHSMWLDAQVTPMRASGQNDDRRP